MKVLKFGGSSVATPERIEMIVNILKGYQENNDTLTVVFSAFGGITDALSNVALLASSGDIGYKDQLNVINKRHIDAAKALIPSPENEESLARLKENAQELKNVLQGIFLVREVSPRTLDYVLSFGERNSAYIISAALNYHGVPADYVDARKIIITDKSFNAANVLLDTTYRKIEAHYESKKNIQVVTGFVAAAKNGLTTTLGRGGSDYTAALLAGGLHAEVVEIWTDVDGVLTSDPKKVKKAFTIPSMTYAEAMEMSHFGAKVLYPPTIQPALAKDIPIRIKNTFNPSFEGTLISHLNNSNGHSVQGISSISNVTLITLQGSGMFGVPGIAGRLFSGLAKDKINVILITQGSSEATISFAIQPKHNRRAVKRIEKEFEFELSTNAIDPIKVEESLSVVAIIGENMRLRPGIARRLFDALGKNGINAVAIAQGSSERNISVVINAEDEKKALNAVHDSFFLSDTSNLNVFMVGVGLIGSELLTQIKQQQEFLRKERKFDLRICGLANTKKMVFDDQGIDLDNWKSVLDTSEVTSNPQGYLDKMASMNLANSIFVDNTAHEVISNLYERIIGASISISTPNKIATSSSFPQYQALKKLAQKRGVKFLYETNVGAGLPIISTLNDLLISGDQILKIEGVLSGSLSFIFNTFDGSRPFSEIVLEAKNQGFTEPDPRIDLMGIDVRRKLIILSREIGLPIEKDDVSIENILPQSCLDAEHVEGFFSELEAHNDHFDQLVKNATAENKKLRMVACLENKKPVIRLQSVGQESPFYGLSGSDNMVIFTTKRYRERPLVVRGPGAGAAVTAAGVFSEIISIGNYLT